MNILELIPKGHENAVGREYLAAIYMKHYGMKKDTADRKMRSDIKEATDAGNLIFHCENGYFQYKDDSDIPYCNSYYRSETAKGWSIINRHKKTKKFLNAKAKGIQTEDGQLSLNLMTGGD